MIKKGIYTIGGVWCILIAWITPIWLTLTYLNLSGQIYKYDFSMDEGTALILGLIMLFIWVIIALIPCVIFLKKMRLVGRRTLAWSISVLAVSVLLGMAMQILRIPKIF